MQITPEEIDELLPQTQCGLCGFHGCMPYAEAIVYEKAPIHLCPPGGIKTLFAIGALCGQDPNPFIAELEAKIKPKQVAIIREIDCIGCTKCIPACPIDAIIGSAKKMHTVIAAECTGCELCIPACPVDCIELIPNDNLNEASFSKKRHLAKKERLKQEEEIKKAKHKAFSLKEKKDYIQSARLRVKLKKLNSNKI